MKSIQEINWSNFKAKFNGKEQATFQWLCYLLFCEKYKQPLGISRYENHAGIETDPIKVGQDIIGWQAKFFNTKLSEHKSVFIAAIDTATSRHPELTKIEFYVNRDFGQDGKKTEPNYKLEIEEYAKKKGISIIWRNNSFFESPFVAKDNAVIAKHFFSSGKSIIDLVDNLKKHTLSILSPIRSGILFKGKELKIDRTNIIEILKTGLKDGVLVILSGEGGVGKTAVIKDLYCAIRERISLFVFKATQFNNIANVDSLLSIYGDFSIEELATTYKDMKEKCIVIDSAEKLLDIEDKEVFNTFINVFLQNKWKIIFTTRHSYLDDLRYMFIGLYGLRFQTQDIQKINLRELTKLSQTFNFSLPRNERMQDLICNPFYLDEYLQNYEEIKRDMTYSEFKKILWNKKIANTSYTKDGTDIRRQECFIAIAKKRAEEGNFYVQVDKLDSAILQKLRSDEIVGYDKNTMGYFITHDIYEEWALEKFIESTFFLKSKIVDFYKNLGSSLPIRRSFRHWLSDKLTVDKNIVKSLIEATISDPAIKSHWKDEVLVSVLLSEHSKNLLELFEEKLLEDDANLLVRITFLLRIACKEIDETTYKSLGLQKTNRIPIQTLFTKPKGSGWDYIIDFINRNKEKLGLNHINAILAILNDWNSKNKRGKTTKAASEIALFYYESIAGHDVFGYQSRDELGKNIIKAILNGSNEIKQKLSSIIDEVVNKGAIAYRDKYYELTKTMLSSLFDSAVVAQAIPEKLLSLVKVYWLRDVKHDDSYTSHSLKMEQYFGLALNLREYHPSSPYQTPTLILLRIASDQTLDFIISFTNKAVEYYKNSSLDRSEIQEVEIFTDDSISRTQYISGRLWEMYRGTHVAPNVLESVHMALEKWLLELGKSTTAEELEKICIYLYKKSKSASITSIIVSVILAYPFKLFNVAAMIFKTKEFFLYDTTRYIKDRSHKSMLEGLKYNFPQQDYLSQVFQDERINACDYKHRGNTLENIALYYQLFRSDKETEEQASERQKTIWKIFDNYYKNLPKFSRKNNADKTWQLYLARMDRRKMQPKVEKKNGQTLISFNPDLESELKKYSKDSLQKNNKAMKYSPLNTWACSRWRKEDGKYKEYKNYENNPLSALHELKNLIHELKKNDKDMNLFYRATPVYVSAVLVRDFNNKLNSEEFHYCEGILVEHASLPFREDYQYSIGDGIEASIGSLPYLYLSSSEKEVIKITLLLLLFNDFPIGMSGARLRDYSISAILNNLWETHLKDAHSLFLGFLLLKPKYESLIDEIRKENIRNVVYEFTLKEVFETFEKRYEEEIDNIIFNRLKYSDIKEIESIDSEILNTAFELLPLGTQDKDHKKFLETIFPLFSKELKDNEKNGYMLSNRFLEKFAYFVLTAKQEEIKEYIKPFVENFKEFEYKADLFRNFITVEDRIYHYEEFWTVWRLFYNTIVNMSKEKWQPHNMDSIIHNYLLAWPYWKKEAKKWPSLKNRERAFFKKVANDMGHHTAVLYSISKLLNDIGSDFVGDGIVWVSDILEKNPHLNSEDLEINTVYYMENLVRNYVFYNRHLVKTNRALNEKMLVILNFLIEKASVAAYLIREDIL
jgi:hypothetical protein